MWRVALEFGDNESIDSQGEITFASFSRIQSIHLSLPKIVYINIML